jgi:hypothetical protein
MGPRLKLPPYIHGFIDHKTLSEVERYTKDADRKRLATSGMAKRLAQSVNTKGANLGAQSGKPIVKSLK